MVVRRYYKVRTNPRYEKEKHNIFHVCKYIQDLANSVTLDHKTVLHYNFPDIHDIVRSFVNTYIVPSDII